MFGGIAFLVDGKMFVGVTNDDLMAVAAWVKRAMAFVDPLVASKSRTRRPRPRLKVRRT